MAKSNRDYLCAKAIIGEETYGVFLGWGGVAEVKKHYYWEFWPISQRHSVDAFYINRRGFSVSVVNPPLQEALVKSEEEFFHLPICVYIAG